MRPSATLAKAVVALMAIVLAGVLAAVLDARPGGLDPCGGGRQGTAATETLTGTPGANAIQGLAGDDRLRGKGGRDCLNGGSGNDLLDGGSGRDRMYGADGNDLILAADGQPDTVDCGDGLDVVTADRADKLADCESVIGNDNSPWNFDYDWTVNIRSVYAEPLLLATVDRLLTCVTSVDHPTVPAGSPGAPSAIETRFNVQTVAKGCGLSASVAVWSIRNPEGSSLGTINVAVSRGQSQTACYTDGDFKCTVNSEQIVTLGP